VESGMESVMGGVGVKVLFLFRYGAFSRMRKVKSKRQIATLRSQ